MKKLDLPKKLAIPSIPQKTSILGKTTLILQL